MGKCDFFDEERNVCRGAPLCAHQNGQVSDGHRVLGEICEKYGRVEKIDHTTKQTSLVNE